MTGAQWQHAKDDVEIEITAEMIARGKAAMIAWHEGCDDFEEGAKAVFLAMCGKAQKTEGETVCPKGL